jgi:hypothetical protein
MKFSLLLSLLCIAVWTFLPAQEMLLNSGFDDDSGWTVYYVGATDTTYYEFGYTGDGPANGSGPCLRVWTEAGSYSNILFWQAVTLEAGKEYQVSGAFCDITDGGVQNFWCEFNISAEAPVEGVDWTPPAGANTDIFLAFNTWTDATCGPETDGTFEDDACVRTEDEDFYYLPDSFTVGEQVTIYVGIKLGTSGGVPFEVLLDEISLIDTSVPSGLQENQPDVAVDYALHQNYPNPFNPETSISFSLPVNNVIDLSVYDVQGKKISTLANQEFTAGTHEVRWDGRNAHGMAVPSGIYFYQLKSAAFTATGKMMLLR